jgi:hypothetical protein
LVLGMDDYHTHMAIRDPVAYRHRPGRGKKSHNHATNSRGKKDGHVN